jgi:hypothetical protein
VERGEVSQCTQALLVLLIEDDRPGELGAAMNDSVSDCVNRPQCADGSL